MAKGIKLKTKEKIQSKEVPLLLDCPQCLSFISEKDINQTDGLAKCSHCDHIFPFKEVLEKGPIGFPFQFQPAGLEILKLESLLEFKISHFKSQDKRSTGFLTFFSVLWNLMLIPFLVFIVSSGQWALLLFISIHLIAGLSMLYKSISSLFNTTTLEVNKNYISMRVNPFPLPWRREIVINVNDIKQFTVEKSKVRNSSSTISYSLFAAMTNGKKKLLIPNLNAETLQYIEKEIEHWLGIK